MKKGRDKKIEAIERENQFLSTFGTISKGHHD